MSPGIPSTNVAFDPLAAKPKRSAKHKQPSKEVKDVSNPKGAGAARQVQGEKDVMDVFLDMQQNEKLYRSELAAAELEFGEQHIEVCRRAGKLADLCYHTGRFVEAEPLLRQALVIAELEAESGPDQAETAKLVNNLGNVLRKQGKLEEARSVHERAVVATQAVFGRSHPHTDTARANLVELLDELNESDKALELLLQAVRDEEAEPESPLKKQRLAGALRGLASIQVKLSKAKDAEVSLSRGLDLFMEALGPNHPATGSTMSALANLLRTEGRNEEAAPHYEKLLAITEVALGPNHPQCGIALRSLAQVKMNLGRHTEAMEDVERGVTIMRGVHGGVHNLMADFLDTKASCAQALGDVDAANAATTEAAAVREKAKELMTAQQDAAKNIDLKRLQGKVGQRQAHLKEPKDVYEEPLLNATQERLRKKLAARNPAAAP